MVSPKIKIKKSDNEDLLDILLCAKEFIDFIDDFKKKFLKGNYFVLTAFFDSVLVGVLIAEKKIREIDALEKIIPKIQLHLLYVNKRYRNMDIGKKLLNVFLNLQKKKGVATVYINIPQNYISGINYLINNDFCLNSRKENIVVMEFNLWNDYGIRDCIIIGEEFQIF